MPKVEFLCPFSLKFAERLGSGLRPEPHRWLECVYENACDNFESKCANVLIQEDPVDRRNDLWVKQISTLPNFILPQFQFSHCAKMCRNFCVRLTQPLARSALYLL